MTGVRAWLRGLFLALRGPLEVLKPEIASRRSGFVVGAAAFLTLEEPTKVRIPAQSDHPFRANPITHSGVFDHPAASGVAT